jgi:hypothetical protein
MISGGMLFLRFFAGYEKSEKGRRAETFPGILRDCGQKSWLFFQIALNTK